jgi:hypothetical protein
MRIQILGEALNQMIFSAWEKITDGVSQGSVMGPLLFLIPYITDMPKTVPILFADDISLIVNSSNSKDFQNYMVTAFGSVNKWFKVNLLSININKTHYMQFKTETSLHLI